MGLANLAEHEISLSRKPLGIPIGARGFRKGCAIYVESKNPLVETFGYPDWGPGFRTWIVLLPASPTENRIASRRTAARSP